MNFKYEAAAVRYIWRKITIAGLDPCEMLIAGDELTDGVRDWQLFPHQSGYDSVVFFPERT